MKIKFRAWAAASRKMFFPSTCDGWEILNGELKPLPNIILMQYIGLKDKNGNDIYEGDILKSRHDIMLVRRSKKCASFCIEKESSLFLKFFEKHIHSDRCEIIGNIYENKELFK